MSSHDFDLADFDEELKNIDEEWEKLGEAFGYVDQLFDWVPLIYELEFSLGNFKKNMSSLKLPHEIIKKTGESENQFILGSLWAATIAAYEGFIHDYFHLILQNEKFYILVIENIEKFRSKGQTIVTLKKQKGESLSKEILERSFREMTLHNPKNSENILNKLFGLKIPALDHKEWQSALEIRHAYAHLNGTLDYKPVKISLEELVELHSKVEKLVETFGSRILGEALSEANYVNSKLE